MDLSLHPRQSDAFLSEATEILYGGAAGGGKSHLFRVAAITWCFDIPGLQVYIFRRLSDDLIKNHCEGPTGFPVLLNEWVEAGHVKIRTQPYSIEFWNGSKIFLGHCQYEKDKYKVLGVEMHVLIMDELTLFTESIYRYFRGRLRLGGLKLPEKYKGLFPRVLAGSNPGGCVPYGEVLTADRGWIDITAIQSGDAVISVDPQGSLVIRRVSAVTAIEHDGEMVIRQSPYLTMEFTPNHRFPHLNTARTRHTVKEFWDLPGEAYIRRTGDDWQGAYPETIHGVDSGDFMELLGWYVSEGCMVKRPEGRKAPGVNGKQYARAKEDSSFQIAQNKHHTRERIEALLIRMGVKYRKDKQSFTITNTGMADEFRKQGYCREKHIPREYANLARPLLERLHESLMLGDGCKKIYYTTSRQLADDVAELATKLGLPAYISSRERENRKGLSYAVNQGGRKHSILYTGNHVYDVDTTCAQVNVSRERFKGMVYCLTVPGTETFFIRQQGSVWLSGNTGHTWVKMAFVDMAPPMTLVKQEKKEGGMLRQYIPAKLADNPTLVENDPDYIDRLEGLGNPALVRAMRDGDWDIVAGGMFEDIWSVAKHVLKPFTIPVSWRIDRGFDWGSSKPFAVVWFAESDGTAATMADGTQRNFPRGTLFIISEWYGWNGKPNEGCRMLATEIARGIRKHDQAMQRTIHPGPADNSIYDVEDGKCMADDMARAPAYVRWTRSDKSPGSRRNGWEMIRKLLKQALGNELPGLYVFDTCRHTIRTLPALPRKESNQDDVDSESEDHIGDVIRYRCSAKRQTAKLTGLRI